MFSLIWCSLHVNTEEFIQWCIWLTLISQIHLKHLFFLTMKRFYFWVHTVSISNSRYIKRKFQPSFFIQPTQVMLVPRFSMVIYLLEWKQVLVIACLMEHAGFIAWFSGFFCLLLCVWEKNHIFIFFWSPLLVYAHAMKQSHNSFSFDNFVAACLLDLLLDISHLLTYRWPCIKISMRPNEFFLWA